MTIEELNEKITKQQTQIDELKSKVLSYESSFSDLNNAISGVFNRISDIENNGIKTAVGDLQEEVSAQRLKINKLDRIRKGLA
nr:MAG TPA: Reovirus sigma C capsid protein [Caudoviricetes sp.]